MTKFVLDDIESELFGQITRTIATTIHSDFPDIVNANNTETHNSSPFLLWDVLNTLLIRKFESSSVLSSKSKRGLWELTLLFDIDSNTVFSFMKDYRIKQLRKRKKLVDHIIWML